MKDFFKEIEDTIIWDFTLENEYKHRQPGYAFIIDVFEKTPQLSLYIIKKNVSKTQTLPKQPAQEMLFKAVKEQSGDLKYERLYDINDEIRNWLKQNIL